MSNVLTEIHDDHRKYSHILNLIRFELDKLNDSSNPSYIRLYDIMHYMTNFPDLVHHPLEEIIFAELAKKKPELSETLAQLSLEHEKLASQGNELKENLHRIVSGDIVSRKALIDSTNAYHQLLTNHMNTEEGRVLPLIDEAFDENDWSILQAQIAVLHDSVFEEVIRKESAQLYERIIQSPELVE
ncbi:MAG: hypothetical protein GKR93_11465 [Gammaproteobacteria bacterium]|nr:hypothetical protein [Gammaproteobacteria bacterium]